MYIAKVTIILVTLYTMYMYSLPVNQVALRCFALPCLDLDNIVRFIPATSVARALGLESRVSWVRVPPEAADFSLPRVSLNCVVFLCVYLEGVLKFVYHVYITVLFPPYMYNSFICNTYISVHLSFHHQFCLHISLFLVYSVPLPPSPSLSPPPPSSLTLPLPSISPSLPLPLSLFCSSSNNYHALASHIHRITPTDAHRLLRIASLSGRPSVVGGRRRRRSQFHSNHSVIFNAIMGRNSSYEVHIHVHNTIQSTRER